mmetsp:Transcript_8267/g.23778  ORF Transcript_8267/g.23778 Transcript_8267/m.23778 type:complete len:136 (+) Transcript_8267:62-469(+)
MTVTEHNDSPDGDKHDSHSKLETITTTWHGPFHRVKSPTQSDETAQLQAESGEMWGRPRQFSDIPQVQAYTGKLDPDTEGIEFLTSVAPDRGTAPGSARWTGPRLGVRIEDDFAKISVLVTKHRQQTEKEIPSKS